MQCIGTAWVVRRRRPVWERCAFRAWNVCQTESFVTQECLWIIAGSGGAVHVHTLQGWVKTVLPCRTVKRANHEAYEPRHDWVDVELYHLRSRATSDAFDDVDSDVDMITYNSVAHHSWPGTEDKISLPRRTLRLLVQWPVLAYRDGI